MSEVDNNLKLAARHICLAIRELEEHGEHDHAIGLHHAIELFEKKHYYRGGQSTVAT